MGRIRHLTSESLLTLSYHRFKVSSSSELNDFSIHVSKQVMEVVPVYQNGKKTKRYTHVYILKTLSSVLRKLRICNDAYCVYMREKAF